MRNGVAEIGCLVILLVLATFILYKGWNVDTNYSPPEVKQYPTFDDLPQEEQDKRIKQYLEMTQ